MGLQRGSRVRAFAGGVLCANSLGHLASAAAGKEHLTPLAGRRSGPAVNAVWGLLNLGGGLLLGRAAAPPGRRWGAELHAFGAGAAGFALWMAASNRVLQTNTGAAPRSRAQGVSAHARAGDRRRP